MLKYYTACVVLILITFYYTYDTRPWIIEELETKVQEEQYNNIFIGGTESSGTRYVSKNVARLIGLRGNWNGNVPECKTINGTSIRHVSIPSMGRCIDGINVVPEVPSCKPGGKKLSMPLRWHANFTSMLELDPKSIAIIITRDSYFTQRSMTRKCKKYTNDHIRITNNEFDMATKIIDQVLKEFPNRVLLISYEVFTRFSWIEWDRIKRFLRLEDSTIEPLPFKSGNK